MERVTTVLLVEDKPDDVFLFRRALESCRPGSRLVVMSTAEEAKSYLLGRGEYADRAAHPIPNYIIVNNVLAIRSGRFLEWLQTHPECGVIHRSCSAARTIPATCSGVTRTERTPILPRPGISRTGITWYVAFSITGSRRKRRRGRRSRRCRKRNVLMASVL